MKIRRGKIISLIVILTLIFGGTVFAFSDIAGDPAETEIKALKELGIVSGTNGGKFEPQARLTYASGVHLIVKAFDLNIDSLRFIKEPLASDYFSDIPNNAWYSQSFLIAYLNGMPIAKDVDSKQFMTKEEFANLLYEAMITQGDFAFIEIWMDIKDGEAINPDYMTGIQRLVISDIVELDDGYFYPDQEITRSEATKMLYKAIQFVEGMNNPVKPELPPADNQDVSMDIIEVNDEVNKVVLSWGFKNSGHEIKINRLDFHENGEAVIYYELLEPDPNKFYPQVMIEPKAEVFVSSKYKPVAKQALGVMNPDTPVSSEALIE